VNIDPANAGYELSGDWTSVQFDSSGKLVYSGTVVRRETSICPKGISGKYKGNNLIQCGA